MKNPKYRKGDVVIVTGGYAGPRRPVRIQVVSQIKRYQRTYAYWMEGHELGIWEEHLDYVEVELI